MRRGKAVHELCGSWKNQAATSVEQKRLIHRFWLDWKKP